jgi:hypothetical protein
MQDDREVQETLPKKVWTAPEGSGIARILQRLPFQRSANGLAGPD